MNDTQVVIQTGTWKVKVILGLGGLATLVILAFMYRVEIGVVILCLGGAGAIRIGFWVRNRYQLEQLARRSLEAQTQQAEAEARMIRWKERQEQAIAQKLLYDALFIERKAGTFVVGDVPFKFYPSASASAQLATPVTLALPAPSLDYFAAMSDPLQAYAIVGAQRVGKSVLAQHLAQHLTGLGRICVVIGTKAEKAEWLTCKRYIGNEAVLEAIGGLLAEFNNRIGKNCKTPIICAFLDDWINSTVLDSSLAEQFFVEASTRFLSAGIVPYFLLQSDSKADWGTKHGATLKNNFVHLLLKAPRVNGQLDHSRLNGVIVYPGDKEQHPVLLPRGLPMLGDGLPDFGLPEPAKRESTRPDDNDALFVELVRSGVSRNQASMQAWGRGYAGNMVERGKRLLGEI